jgi:thiamine kinase-like enzyme
MHLSPCEGHEHARFEQFLSQQLDQCAEKSVRKLIECFKEKLQIHLNAYSALPLVFSHGDLHADNIILSRDGAVFIADWDTYGFRPICFDLVTFFEEDVDDDLFKTIIDDYLDLIEFSDCRAKRGYVTSLVVIFVAMLNNRTVPANWLEVAVANYNS